MPVDRTQLEALHTGLTDRLAALTTGDEWLAWLTSARRFHRYSPANQLLLAAQGATGHVASYRTWQRIPAVGGGTCQVRKGKHGLTILAPMTVTRRDIDEASGDEIVVTTGLRGFKAVKVFHQDQLVDPPDLPDQPLPALLTGDNRHQHLWAAIVSHLGDLGYTTQLVCRSPFETWNGRTNFATAEVSVAEHLQAPQRLKTLVHEWAHIALEHGEQPGRDRSVIEVEAESVAYLVCATVGLDAATYTVPYLASWSSGEPALLETTAQRVLAITVEMVDTLETELSIDLTPDLLGGPRAGNVTPLPTANRPTGPEPGPTPASSMARHPSTGLHLVAPVEVEATPTLDGAPAGPARDVLARLANESDRRLFLYAIDRLDTDLDLATLMCADAGIDPTATIELLTGLGVDRTTVIASMTRPVTSTFDPEPQPLFPDISDVPLPPPTLLDRHDGPTGADRTGAAAGMLAPADQAVQDAMNLRNPDHLATAARLIHDLGFDTAVAGEMLEHFGDQPAAVGEVLQQSFYDPVTATMQPLWPPTEPAPPDRPDPSDPTRRLDPGVADWDRTAIAHVAAAGDAHRLALLADALDLSGPTAVSLWADVGVTPRLAAAAALERCDGDIDAATKVLAAGWTDQPIAWSEHFPPPASTVPGTAQAILEQWAALTEAPGGSMQPADLT